ncbi:MAG: LysR family transcriptional regulator [Candidatus Eremiobacterota bacterium]
MRVKVKISIINDKEESFMGIGLVWLLRKIKETGSISQAAKDMDMSYAKAHRIIKRLEKNIGAKILDTKTGGIDRGGALLTHFAEDFIDKYDKYQKKIKEYGEKEFLVFLRDIGDKMDEI